MKWQEVEEVLGLDMAIAARARQIVEKLKSDIVQLFLQPSVENATSPMQLLVPDKDPNETRKALERFLFMHRPVGATKTYSDLVHGHENAARKDILALCPSEFEHRFNALKIESLLAIDTGTDPIGEAARRFHNKGAADTQGASVEKRAVHELISNIGLAPEEVQALVAGINEAKDKFAELFSSKPSKGGPSPVEYLAACLERSEPSALGKMLAFASENTESQSGLPYTAAYMRVEAATRARIAERIGFAKWQRVVAVLPPSLLDVETGYEPFTQAVQYSRTPTP